MITCGYIFTNLISGMTSITASSEDSTYTSASLYDRRINKPFRFTSKSSQTLLFNLFAAYAVDIIVILKHNFTSAATLTLKAGTTGAVSDFTQTLTWASTNLYKRFTEQTYQYWQLEVSDPTNPRNPEMGELYLGMAAQFSRAYAWGSEEGHVFAVDEHKTEFGTRIIYPKYDVRTRRLAFAPASESAKNEIRTMYLTASGSLFPIVLFPDFSANDCIFGRLTNNFGAVASPAPNFSTGCEFTEESKGGTVT